jgi:hypothetical protein
MSLSARDCQKLDVVLPQQQTVDVGGDAVSRFSVHTSLSAGEVLLTLKAPGQADSVFIAMAQADFLEMMNAFDQKRGGFDRAGFDALMGRLKLGDHSGALAALAQLKDLPAELGKMADWARFVGGDIYRSENRRDRGVVDYSASKMSEGMRARRSGAGSGLVARIQGALTEVFGAGGHDILGKLGVHSRYTEGAVLVDGMSGPEVEALQDLFFAFYHVRLEDGTVVDMNASSRDKVRAWMQILDTAARTETSVKDIIWSKREVVEGQQETIDEQESTIGALKDAIAAGEVTIGNLHDVIQKQSGLLAQAITDLSKFSPAEAALKVEAMVAMKAGASTPEVAALHQKALQQSLDGMRNDAGPIAYARMLARLNPETVTAIGENLGDWKMAAGAAFETMGLSELARLSSEPDAMVLYDEVVGAGARWNLVDEFKARLGRASDAAARSEIVKHLRTIAASGDMRLAADVGDALSRALQAQFRGDKLGGNARAFVRDLVSHPELLAGAAAPAFLAGLVARDSEPDPIKLRVIDHALLWHAQDIDAEQRAFGGFLGHAMVSFGSRDGWTAALGARVAEHRSSWGARHSFDDREVAIAALEISTHTPELRALVLGRLQASGVWGDLGPVAERTVSGGAAQ